MWNLCLSISDILAAPELLDMLLKLDIRNTTKHQVILIFDHVDPY
jgi:hypothetical protein